jgi:hypothetical protein
MKHNKNNNIQTIPFLSKDPDARTGIFGVAPPFGRAFLGSRFAIGDREAA